MKLKYYQDRKGDWRWTLYARNGNVVGASSEGYKTRAKAVANFAAVTTKGPSATVEVVEKAKKAPAKQAPAKKVPAKKAPAKRAATKEAPAKKVPAQKAPAKQTPAKKAPAKKAAAKKA